MNGNKNADIAFLRKYEQILAVPMRTRKQIIRAAKPTEKSDFWKAQLVYHLATAKLNQSQFEFITELFPLMTPGAFNFPTVEGQDKNEETKTLEAFASKANELFSDDESFTILMGYGIHKTKSINTVGKDINKVKTTELTGKNGTVTTNTWGDGEIMPESMRTCDCNYMCGWGETCTTTSCGISTDGCGVFGGSECHSYCMTSY